MKIKIRSADRRFSNYIRDTRNWTCEYCGRICKVNGEIRYKLENSHYLSRKFENTRFDPENCHALCFQCHQKLGGYTRTENGEYDLWMKKLLGDRYRKLVIRAHLTGKKDDTKILIWLKSLGY